MALIDAQHIADSILIEKFVGGHWGGPSTPLQKIAGVSEIFQSVAQGIYSEVAKMWDPNDPLKSILNFTATGLITIFGPWWMGLIYVIASEFFGVDFGTLFDKIKDQVANTLKEKRSISVQDIASAVASNVGGSSAASDHLTAMSDEQMFRKMAHLSDAYRDTLLRGAALEKNAQLGMLLAPFKFLIKKVVAPPVAKSFLGKVLSFIFKSLIIGVAKAKAGEVGRALVGGTSAKGDTSPGFISNFLGNTGAQSQKFPHTMKPTSFGTTIEGANWEEDFPLSSVANQLVDWATQRYPQLAQHRDTIQQTESFKNVVKAIQGNNTRNNYDSITYIPHQMLGATVNSKAEIVELFAGEAAHKIGL